MPAERPPRVYDRERLTTVHARLESSLALISAEVNDLYAADRSGLAGGLRHVEDGLRETFSRLTRLIAAAEAREELDAR